jgi:hypothetical protein
MQRRMIGIAAALVLLASCGEETTGPDDTRMPGALAVSGWTAGVPLAAGNGGNVTWGPGIQASDIAPAQVIVAPDTVTAGVPFEVITYTVGVSGCWRSDGQTVTMLGRTVRLRPYDSHSGSEVCTGALQFLEHRSTLVLGQAGEWTLRVEGRRLRLHDEVWDEPISAERAIIVR